jgi:hypothetical protein
MAKITLALAALIATIMAVPVAVAVPASAQAVTAAPASCPKDWAACTMEQKLAIAKATCDAQGFSAADIEKMQLKDAPREQFLAKVGCIKARQVAAPLPDPDPDARDDDEPKPVTYRRSASRGGLTSFDNVAAGSHHVRTRTGKNYDLGRLRGSPQSCVLPMQWRRTDFCKPIGGGGITCKMVCR